MSERDYAGAVDALQGDMARHQRRFAPEVTATENQKLAVSTIERLEKQDAEAPPVPAPQAIQPPLPPLNEERDVDGRKYTFDRGKDVPLYRTASEFEQQVLIHAQPRIELLMSKQDTGPLGSPSWQTKTLAAMYFKVKSLEAGKSGRTDLAEYYEQAFQLDLSELLEASNASFGDWRKDKPTKIIVSG
jgi:hypothetical protein